MQVHQSPTPLAGAGNKLRRGIAPVATWAEAFQILILLTLDLILSLNLETTTRVAHPRPRRPATPSERSEERAGTTPATLNGRVVEKDARAGKGKREFFLSLEVL
jgi:hypothetical protein